jgi:lambda family phage tail tape measure protein
MAQNIARLGVVLGIDTAQFTTGLDKAKKSLSQVGDFATKAAAVAGAAFVAMTYKALQFSDEMADLADATGVSIAKILQLSNASQRAGGTFESGSRALTKFIANIDTAASGSEEMQKSFAKAGVSLDDLANLSVEQLLNKTSQGITKIGDSATQAGTKMDLFGRSMRTVSMDIFNQYIQQSTTEFEKYEAAIQNAAEITDRFEQIANKLGLTFIEKVMPSLNYFFETVATEGSSAFTVFNGILDGTAWVIRNFALGIEALSAGIKVLSVSAKAFFGSISEDDAWKQMVNIENAFNKARSKYFEVEQAQKKPISPATDAPQKRKIELGSEAKKEADKQAEMLKVAKLISDEYNRQQVYALQQLAIREQMVGMTNDERRLQEAINQVTNETSRKIDEITRKREDAAGRGANAEVIAEYDKQIAKVYELEEVYITMTRNMESASIASQRTFQFGWDKTFAQFAEDAYNYARIAEQAFKSITDNMLSALDNFVDTGKFKFSDFASSVIKDLIKIQLRAQATQLMSKFIGSFGGFLGGAMGGPQPLGSMGGAGFSARAAGGSVSQNNPYMIGENGPELFIPQRSGTVIPNQQMSSMGNSQPQVVYNGTVVQNMTAIDTQSAVQFLAKNKEAVWSANQSASRGIPASRT